MKLYKIKDWEKHFEVRDTNRVDGPLKWVPIPTKTDGFGFSRLAAEKDAPQLLAAWYLMLGIAAKQERTHRGQLMRDGRPLTDQDLATITRFPKNIFSRAMAFFSSVEQGWMVCEEVETAVNQSEATNSDDKCASMDHKCASGVPTGQDRTRQERTGQDTTQQGQGVAKKPHQLRAEAIFGKRPSTPPDAAEARAWQHAHAVVEATTDEEWAALEAFYSAKESKDRPLYRRRDLATLLNNWSGEIAKARKWQSTRSAYEEAF